MSNVTPPPRAHPALLLAAAASAAAGLVHAGAAGSHAELTFLATGYAVVGVAQVGWAALAVTRPGRLTVALGAAVQLFALGVWALSRTVGIGFVDGLEEPLSMGFPDGLAVALQCVALVGAVASLGRLPSGRGWTPAAGALGAVALLAAVPAMASEHDHGSHAHGDEVVAAHGDDHHAADDHHSDADDHHSDGDDHHADDAGDEVAAAAEVVPVPADLVYPEPFHAWIHDPDLTPEQQQAAEELLVETTEAMKAQFPDEAAVQAAGYISIGDGATGWEHYINIGLIADDKTLDPNAIESIVLKIHPDGTKEVASAMYLLGFGTTMADVPEIAGDLTVWHDHQNLCWEGYTVVGTTNATGECRRGEFRPTQPMMHVWMIDHPCGPFAGIEGSHGSGCDHHDHGDEAAGADMAPEASSEIHVHDDGELHDHG